VSEIFDLTALWIGRVLLMSGGLWFGLCIFDKAFTRILKYFNAYWVLCEYAFMRKRFNEWMRERTPNHNDETLAKWRKEHEEELK